MSQFAVASCRFKDVKEGGGITVNTTNWPFPYFHRSLRQPAPIPFPFSSQYFYSCVLVTVSCHTRSCRRSNSNLEAYPPFLRRQTAVASSAGMHHRYDHAVDDYPHSQSGHWTPHTSANVTADLQHVALNTTQTLFLNRTTSMILPSKIVFSTRACCHASTENSSKRLCIHALHHFRF